MKRLLHSIYVKFVLLFVGILVLSALLALGIVTMFQLEDVREMVKKETEDKVAVIDSLVNERGIPVRAATTYLNEKDLIIRVYDHGEKLLKEKSFAIDNNDLKRLEDRDILTKELFSHPPLPVSVSSIKGHYVAVYPNFENNQIVRFQKTAQTVLFTAIFLGSLLIVLAVSMVIKPIKKISNASVKVANGEFDVSVQHKTKDEVGELVKNFNIMVQELKSNEYLHKEFVSSVSHEFKTPLSSINGFAKLLKSQDLSETEKDEYTDIIIKESQRLSNLSSNLLRLSKLDHQVIQYKRDRFILDEQIRQVILLLQDQWERKHIQLYVDMESIPIHGDEELLQQVWLNLINNAIKFTPNQGNISILLKKQDNNVVFSIADNGIGIDKKDVKVIFERFYKVDKSRSHQGTGLGLSIVKKIVEIHGGKIHVESEIGEGSIFTIELPEELLGDL